MATRRVFTLVLAGASFLSAVPAQAYHSQRQAELEQLIEDQRDKIQDNKAQERSLLSQIDASDRRHEILIAQLRTARATLAEAEAELARIADKLQVLDDQVRSKTTELEGLLGELYQLESEMDDRVADFYINAPSQLGLTTGAVQVTDAVDAFGFAQSIFQRDQEIAASIQHAKDAVTARRTELQIAQEQVTEAHNAQERETERLANAEASVERATIAVEAELETKRSLVKKVRGQREEYLRILQSYEQENARITAFLQEAGSSSGSSGSTASEGGYFIWPVRGPITSPYGWRTHPIYGTRRFHTGIDLGVGSGTPIGAGRTGTVIDTGYMGAYGLSAIIDHGGGVATLYAHMSSIRVGQGQRVSTGETVGLVGSTGYSTGPHLHFEVRVNGAHQNPMSWL
jgi:murein DD-endopeptidase MepM/ murein hydrolase activator NlpD